MPIGDVLAVIDEPARVSEGPVERGNSFMLSKDGEEKEARQAAVTGWEEAQRPRNEVGSLSLPGVLDY